MHIVFKLHLDMNGVRIQVHLNWNAYYAWADNKRIGVPIRDRKYLNRCTPFLDVSLWYGTVMRFTVKTLDYIILYNSNTWLDIWLYNVV